MIDTRNFILKIEIREQKIFETQNLVCDFNQVLCLCTVSYTSGWEILSKWWHWGFPKLIERGWFKGTVKVSCFASIAIF